MRKLFFLTFLILFCSKQFLLSWYGDHIDDWADKRATKNPYLSPQRNLEAAYIRKKFYLERAIEKVASSKVICQDDPEKIALLEWLDEFLTTKLKKTEAWPQIVYEKIVKKTIVNKQSYKTFKRNYESSNDHFLPEDIDKLKALISLFENIETQLPKYYGEKVEKAKNQYVGVFCMELLEHFQYNPSLAPTFLDFLFTHDRFRIFMPVLNNLQYNYEKFINTIKDMDEKIKNTYTEGFFIAIMRDCFEAAFPLAKQTIPPNKDTPQAGAPSQADTPSQESVFVQAAAPPQAGTPFQKSACVQAEAPSQADGPLNMQHPPRNISFLDINKNHSPNPSYPEIVDILIGKGEDKDVNILKMLKKNIAKLNNNDIETTHTVFREMTTDGL